MAFFDSVKRYFGFGPEEISCEEALQLVHDFIDGELDGLPRAEVEAHFELCQQCYPHLKLEQRFRAAVHRACVKDTAPPDLRTRVMEIVSQDPKED
jgi:anti-sigma factor (TIGR02949 family)